MFDVLELAKYIVTKCTCDKHPISNLQLQKILYYIQKEYLLQDDVAFLSPIEAWQYGPVVPSVYSKFCGSGAMPIAMKYVAPKLDSPTDKVDAIVEEKRAIDPWKLVAETHRTDGAWYKVYDNGNGRGKEIPRYLIKECG